MCCEINSKYFCNTTKLDLGVDSLLDMIRKTEKLKSCTLKVNLKTRFFLKFYDQSL